MPCLLSHLDCKILVGKTLSYNHLSQCVMLQKVIKFTGMQENNELPSFSKPCHTTLPACGMRQCFAFCHWLYSSSVSTVITLEFPKPSLQLQLFLGLDG